MLRYFGTKENVAAFVDDLQAHLKIDSQLITIMRQGKYAACSVRIATGTLLAVTVETVASIYLLKPLPT